MLAGGEKDDGEVRRITLRHETGGNVRIAVPGYQRMKLHREGASKEVELPCELELERGEAIEGKPIR